MTTSLQVALSETSLSRSAVESLYGPFQTLTTRILGTPPGFFPLAHASPIAITLCLGAFRPCFRAPYCDFGLLRITPEHRRTALLEGAITHQCPYCIGHAASMGDMLRGPVVQQCSRRGDMDITKTPSDAALVQLIHEVCSFPGVLTAETRAAFVEVHGEDGFAQFAPMLSFMGFLNFVMSATGMQLESRILPFAELSLDDKKVPFNLREIKDDNREEERLGEEEVSKLKEPLGFVGKFFAHMKNVMNVFGLLVPTASAHMMEMRWYSGIPNSVVGLDAWCLDKLGVLLGVFKNVDNLVLKRAMALGLQLVFMDECPWTIRERSTFLYVFAVGVGNATLKDDAVALYKECTKDLDSGEGSAISNLEGALKLARSGEPSDRFSAALKYVDVCAGPGGRITEDVIDGLLRFVGEHRDLVDVAGMIGCFGLLQRASVLYPDDR